MSGKGFKGSLSSLYHENRAAIKGMKVRQLENKARREQEKEQEDAQKEHPLHAIRLDGRAARLVRNDAAFYAQQTEEGLVPWAGAADCLIDRYDVRALLDMYVAPDARALRGPPKSEAEAELEEQLRFEAFRDLIRLRCLRLTEGQGIRHAQQENVALRAQARSMLERARAAAEAAVAAAQAGQAAKGGLPSQASLYSAAAVGGGQYAAVGFNYGGDTLGGGGGDEEGGAGESESEDEEDAAPATAEDADMDRLALADFHLEEFSSMLRWAMRLEAEEAEASAARRRRRAGWGRKKAVLRAKRLAGQGLDPAAYAKGPPRGSGAGGTAAGAGAGADLSWIPELAPGDAAAAAAARYSRDSPEYKERGGRRSRSRSRSRSPGGRRGGGRGAAPQPQYITTFGAGSGGGTTWAGGAGAPGGAAPAPAAARVREALPGAADPALEGPALLPAEALKLHGVRPSERHERDRGSRYGSVSGRDYSKPRPGNPAAAPPKPVDRAKETPQERLKRMMQLQLAKKIQKDSLTEAQKKQKKEGERAAREANQALAEEEERRRSRGRRGRSRSRSTSRGRRRGGSRSRSRSRSRGRGGGASYRRSSRSRSRERRR
eukprot:scaffold2.g7432.t1